LSFRMCRRLELRIAATSRLIDGIPGMSVTLDAGVFNFCGLISRAFLFFCNVAHPVLWPEILPNCTI